MKAPRDIKKELNGYLRELHLPAIRGCFEEKARQALHDERVAALDAAANELLAKIDTLGTVDTPATPDCSKLAELSAASLELQATVKTKAAYLLSKLDQMLAIEADAKERPVLVGAMVGPEEDRLKVGERECAGHALARSHEARRGRVGLGRVRQVKLRQSVAVRHEQDLSAVAGQHRLGVREGLQHGGGDLGQLGLASGGCAARHVGRHNLRRRHGRGRRRWSAPRSRAGAGEDEEE